MVKKKLDSSIQRNKIALMSVIGVVCALTLAASIANAQVCRDELNIHSNLVDRTIVIRGIGEYSYSLSELGAPAGWSGECEINALGGVYEIGNYGVDYGVEIEYPSGEVDVLYPAIGRVIRINDANPGDRYTIRVVNLSDRDLVCPNVSCDECHPVMIRAFWVPGSRSEPQPEPAPADILVSSLSRTNPGGLRAILSLDGQAIPSNFELGFFYFGSFGKQLIVPQISHPWFNGTKEFTVTTEDLHNNAPTGVRGIGVEADPANSILEPNEDNNGAVFVLPDYRIGSLNWRGERGVDFDIDVRFSRTPYNQNPEWRLLWLYDSELGLLDDLVENSRTIRVGRIPKDEGRHRVHLERIPYPSSGMWRNQQPTHLAVVLDKAHRVTARAGQFFGEVLESNENNNIYLIPLGEVSFELRRAPYGEEANQRVAKWLESRARTIQRAAKRYNVDPRAIAGAIAWEALENPKTRHWLLGVALSRGFGPGKVHQNNADYVECQGWIADISPQATRRKLRSPRGAINYIAAIMNAYAIEAEKADPPYEIRSSPGLLCNLYNGSSAGSVEECVNSNYFVAQRALGRELEVDPDPMHMGMWTLNNLDDIVIWLGLRRLYAPEPGAPDKPYLGGCP